MPFVEIDGLHIHYQTVSDPARQRGQRVLYVHGTGCNTRVWEDHMAAIADAHTPVAIDLPGHGQSQGRGFRGVADYAYFAVQLAKRLGWERFVMAGHSMGGGIAITAALYDAPLLSGLMLIDTGARLRVNPVLLQSTREAAERGRKPAKDRSWGYADSTPQIIVDEVAALTEGTNPWVTYADWIADDTFDAMTRLKEIRIPALAVCGEQDRLTPLKYHEHLRATLPDCRLAVIKNAGHWSYREQPAEFNRVVRAFLDGLPAA